MLRTYSLCMAESLCAARWSEQLDMTDAVCFSCVNSLSQRPLKLPKEKRRGGTWKNLPEERLRLILRWWTWMVWRSWWVTLPQCCTWAIDLLLCFWTFWSIIILNDIKPMISLASLVLKALQSFCSDNPDECLGVTRGRESEQKHQGIKHECSCDWGVYTEW